jgi:hypothetical protein
MQTSIVFTIWGVWEINCPQTYRIEGGKKEELLAKIQVALDWIYKNTNNGRANPLSPEQLDMMAFTVKKLLQYIQSKGLDLKISFTDWRQVGNKPYALIYN